MLIFSQMVWVWIKLQRILKCSVCTVPLRDVRALWGQCQAVPTTIAEVLAMSNWRADQLLGSVDICMLW